MKVETGATNLFSSQRTQTHANKSDGQSNAFANILAEKMQAAPGKSASATAGDSDVGKQYDFTHMSRNELLEKVNGLIQSGDLTLDDTTSLLGFMGSSPLLKVDYDGLPLENGDVPMNVFEQIKASMEGARSRNETDSVEGLQRALDALMKFQKSNIAVQA